MPTITNNGSESWRLRTSKEQWIRWVCWLIGIAIIMYAWQMISEKTVWFFVTDAPNQAADIGARMVPPKWSYMDKLWKPVWDTINIATLGTVIAMVIAVPVAFATARNTTPNIVVRSIGLFIIVSSRSVNSLIWALILVFILGPGVLAGTIAIGLRSVGFCAKLIYESIEEIDHTQVEAIEATGLLIPINIFLNSSCWCRRNWFTIKWFPEYASLDTSIFNFDSHIGNCFHIRMGFS